MISSFLQGLESVFSWLLEASWQASVLAALVLLLQVVLRDRLNPRWRHALWLLVIARLILPVLPESALSLFQFTPRPIPVVTQTVTEPIFTFQPAPYLPAPSLPAIDASYPVSIYTILSLLWLAGATGFLILTWYVNLRFGRHVAKAPPITDPGMLQIAADAQARLGIHRSIRLIESAQVQGPAIMGLLHPTLALPPGIRAQFSDEEIEFIFLHELAHLKRGDLALQWLIAALQIFHWFNPILWYAFRLMKTDRETATDALVLSRAGEARKETYGQVLVKLLEHYHQRHSLPTLVGILEDKDQFKRRFLLITRFTRGAYGWSLLGVLLIAILAITLLTKSRIVPISATPSGSLSEIGDARVELFVGGKPILLPKGSQKNVLKLMHDLLVMRYVNGTPDSIFHWQQAPGTTLDQIKGNGSFLHIAYSHRPTVPVGSNYSYQPKEIWIGLQGVSAGQCYPGYPGGIYVVTDGKDGTFDLMFESRSLLVGVGLDPGIYPSLPPAMQKSVNAHREDFQTYQNWIARMDSSGKPVDQQIIVAVQAGDLATLQRLAAQGLDITRVKGNDPTLLFQAGSPEIAEFLIQHGTEVRATSASGTTALDAIVFKDGPKTAEIARVLLEHGAEPNRPSGELKMTPALNAYRGDTLEVLVAHGADLKAVNADGWGALMLAGRHDVTYLQSLIRHGVVFDPKADGPTVMLQAAWINNLPLMKWLIDHGADPSAQGVWYRNRNMKDDLMTPLEATVISGEPNAAKLLLEHGATWDRAEALALQNHYTTIVKLLWDHGDRHISELCYAVSQGESLGELEKILQKDGAIDPPQDSIVSPLGEACEKEALPVVEWLVQHGADVNRGGRPVPEHSQFRDTPLVLAAQRGQDQIVDYLLQHGARPDANALYGAANAGIPSSFYGAQEHLPAKEHYERIIQLLIDAGAAKGISPESTGLVLSKAMSPCWGDANPVVLKKLLAAGLSPQAPSPYPAERGEQPNTVIGYFREFYQKHLGNPGYAPSLATLKPLLDLLEAARNPSPPPGSGQPVTTTAGNFNSNQATPPRQDSDTTLGSTISTSKAAASVPPSQQNPSWPVPSSANVIGLLLADSGEVGRPSEPAINDTIDRLTIHQLDAVNMPLQDFMGEMARQLKKEHPEQPLWSTELTSPDKPFLITFHLPQPASVRQILQRLSTSYPIRFQFRGAPNDFTVWQIGDFERAFDQKAAGTKIQWDLGQTDVRTALPAIEKAATAQGFEFKISGIEKIGNNFGTTDNAPVVLPRGPITVDQALRRVLTAGNLRLLGAQGRIETSPWQSDFPMKDAAFAAKTPTTPPSAFDSSHPSGPTQAEMLAVEASQTPLMKALERQDYDQARALLAQGADVNAQDKMGKTALAFLVDYAGGDKPYPLDILRSILQRAHDPNPQDPLEFCTPPMSSPVLDVSFMAAAQATDPAHLAETRQAVQLLLDHGAHFNRVSGEVDQLLQAAVRGDLPLLQRMVAEGTAVSSADADGWTPLLLTLALGHDEATNWLIDHGADVNAPTTRGAEDPLIYAGDRGSDDLIEKLIAHGAKAGGAWRGLEKAVDRNDQRLFDDLIKLGANMKDAGSMHASGQGGKMWRQITSEPLYTCIERNQKAMAITLLNQGVEAEPADVRNNQNYAYWAVHFDRPEILRALLDHGANPLTEDNVGETPLSLAQKSRPDLVPILEAAIRQPSTPSTTSSPENPRQILGHETGITSGEDNRQAYIETELADLTNRLQLTTQQQASVKAAMEAVGRGVTGKSVDQILRETGTPRQMTAWVQILSADRAGMARERASVESKRIANLVSLDSAKQSQLLSALYPAELDRLTAAATAHSAADYFDIASTHLRERDAAFAKVLTRTQLAILRFDDERRAATAAVDVSAPIKTPAFSLTGN
jgi:beta-lactamase regulating signal transducer with metallopeptidase domain/ankyrin repeat protein